MSEITKVALDAMGGDNAPSEAVKGAIDAINKRKDISFDMSFLMFLNISFMLNFPKILAV